MQEQQAARKGLQKCLNGRQQMKNDYLVTKRPVVALAVFFLPIMLGNLFQQLYNLVDAAIVGQFVNEKAVAAVGAWCSFSASKAWVLS